MHARLLRNQRFAMIDHDLSRLRRMRRYTDPFEDEGPSPDREGYVKWFGLWVREPTLFAVGFSLAGVMLGLVMARALLVGRAAWLPAGEWWFEIGFLAVIVLMCGVSCSMFVCGSVAVRRQIRHMNAQMARWDDATPEEVEEIVRAADRRFYRRIWRRTVFWLVVMVALLVIVGTTWLFPWGGTVAFVASIAAVVVASVVWSWQGDRVLSVVGRRMKRSP